MKNFALGCAGVLAIVLALCCVILVQDTHKTMADLDAAVLSASQDLHGAVQNTNAVLLQLGLTADEVRRAATEERANWQATSKETALTMREARTILDRFDRRVNDVILPELFNDQGNITAAATGALDALSHSADTLTLQLQDPHIMAIAGNLDQATVKLAQTSSHLEGATSDIEKKVHQLTRPASTAKVIGTTVLEIGAKIGSILAGFLKF